MKIKQIFPFFVNRSKMSIIGTVIKQPHVDCWRGNSKNGQGNSSAGSASSAIHTEQIVQTHVDYRKESRTKFKFNYSNYLPMNTSEPTVTMPSSQLRGYQPVRNESNKSFIFNKE